jgi:hypothetical protein
MNGLGWSGIVFTDKAVDGGLKADDGVEDTVGSACAP